MLEQRDELLADHFRGGEQTRFHLAVITLPLARSRLCGHNVMHFHIPTLPNQGDDAHPSTLRKAPNDQGKLGFGRHRNRAALHELATTVRHPERFFKGKPSQMPRLFVLPRVTLKISGHVFDEFTARCAETDGKKHGGEIGSAAVQ
jgi:hypothetical protein